MRKIILFALAILIIALPVQASTNLYEFYKEKGENLPPRSVRAEIWSKISPTKYVASYDQNQRMLAYLKDNDQLGSNIPLSAVNWYLTSPHTAAQTTIDVTNFQDLRGNIVTHWPTKIYLVIEPNNSNNTEIVVCPSSGVDQTNTKFSSCTRGLSFSSSSEAAVTDNKKSHSAGALVIITNPGQFYNNFVDIDSAQTVGGNKSFTGQIDFGDLLPTGTTTAPTLDAQMATKKYVDDTAFSGSPVATYSNKGLSELATSSEYAVGTKYGSSGAYLVLTSESVASTSAAKTMIPATKSNGKLSTGFIDQTANYTWTGSTTIKELVVTKKAKISSSTFETAAAFTVLPTAPTTTAPVEGQVVVMTDGNKLPAVNGSNLTNVSVSSNCGGSYYDGNTGIQTIAHGLGRTPKVVMYSLGVYGGSTFNSTGSYANGSQTVLYYTGGNFTTAANLTHYSVQGGGNNYYASTTVDSTNIYIHWTKASSPNRVDFTWTAF